MHVSHISAVFISPPSAAIIQHRILLCVEDSNRKLRAYFYDTCLPACLEQDITIYRILCDRDITYYVLDAVTLSQILKAKQKLGLTFDSDKLGVIDFTKLSKLTMCSAGAGRCWLAWMLRLPPRHCT